MAYEDKIKWNKKYKENISLLEYREPSKRLKEAVKNTIGIKALDVACGIGKNSIYLAKMGFKVEAIDISEIALKELRKKNIENIFTKQIDLENFLPQKKSYDLIVKTNYLDRKLIPYLIKALKKNGILFIETYMEDKNNEKISSNPNFLLKKGELKTFFDKDIIKIIFYDEFDNGDYEQYRMKKQAICVKVR